MTEKKDNEALDVAYVARLARLELADHEIRDFQGQLEDVVGYVQKIQELDVSAVEPTAHPAPVVNVFREDVVGPSLDREDVLNNAPLHDEDQFLVPKIVE